MRPVVHRVQHLASHSGQSVALKGQQKGHRGQAFPWCCHVALVFKGLLPTGISKKTMNRASGQHSSPAWSTTGRKMVWEGYSRVVALEGGKYSSHFLPIFSVLFVNPVLTHGFSNVLSVPTGVHASFPTGEIVTFCVHFRLKRGNIQVLIVVKLLK